jgi:hypothetical protein
LESSFDCSIIQTVRRLRAGTLFAPKRPRLAVHEQDDACGGGHAVRENPVECDHFSSRALLDSQDDLFVVRVRAESGSRRVHFPGPESLLRPAVSGRGCQ